MVVWSYRHACTQHNLTVLTVTSCNIEYLLRYSHAPVVSAHYQHCELLSNVCMSEREGSAGQQWSIADLNSVGLKVQHQNGCEDVLGTWPPLLSHFAMSCQGFQEYIYARYALLCCRRIYKFATCGLK